MNTIPYVSGKIRILSVVAVLISASGVHVLSQDGNIDGCAAVSASMEQPAFPGGESAMFRWINEHLRYPAIAQENGVQGRVVVRATISETGEVEAAEVVRSVDPSLDKEAVRVVKAMPEWKPAVRDGVAVKSTYDIPLVFRLR